jgi:hypothetical protein
MPQSIPEGSLLTVPFPDVLTVNVRSAAGGVQAGSEHSASFKSS